jgi:hypothetical protein
MASLWQFFGLPNPDGPSAETKPALQTPAASTPKAAPLQKKPQSSITKQPAAPSPTQLKNRIEETPAIEMSVKITTSKLEGTCHCRR